MLILTPGLMGADGIGAASRSVVRALSPHSHDARPPLLDVISLHDAPDAVPWPGSPHVGFHAAGGMRRRFVADTLRVIARRRYEDVICLHVHLAPVTLAPKLLGVRTTFVLWGIEAWVKVRPREALALRAAHRIIAISRETVRRFRVANPGLAALPVGICHLGVCADPRPTAATAEELGQVAALPRPFALIVGRMSSVERYKGHDPMIDVWNDVARAVPGATLVVAGTGDDRQRLERRAAAEGLVDRVRFVGRVSDGMLQQLYAACAFYSMPSRGEGLGVSFLEAMRAGRACLAAESGATDVVEHERTGLVIHGEDRDELRNALVRLFADPCRREEMAARGLAAFRERLTEAAFHERFRHVIAGVAAGGTQADGDGAPCAA